MERVNVLSVYQKFLSRAFKVVVLFLFTLLCIRLFFFSPGRVNGRSMEPTFIDDEYFLVNRFEYFFKEPQRFDVVQIVSQKNELILKRVIGLPGETVIIKGGRVHISRSDGTKSNEFLIDEAHYLASRAHTTVGKRQRGPVEFEVGPKEYFVLGDNRRLSGDSREHGPIHRSYIIGRAIKLGT